jgi:hypothetical protein
LINCCVSRIININIAISCVYISHLYLNRFITVLISLSRSYTWWFIKSFENTYKSRFSYKIGFITIGIR